jgi:DNA-binding transcriptional LysR family regulator
VLRDRLVALLPATHPLAGRESLSFRELGGTPLILFEQGAPVNDVLTDQITRAGARVSVSAYSSQADLLFELVAAGVGLAFMPSLLEESRPHRHVRALPLQAPGVDWTVRVAWRRDGLLSRAAQQWIALAIGQREGEQPKVDAESAPLRGRD